MNYDIIYGKSIKLWEESWEEIGILAEQNIKKCDNYIGIYRINTPKYVYIGKGTEYKKGLDKRLTDYIRKSDSARKSKVAKYINKHAHESYVSVIKIGKDKHSICAAAYLENYFIFKLKPNGNTHGRKKQIV